MRWLFGWKALIIGLLIFSFFAIFIAYYSRDAREMLTDAVDYVTVDVLGLRSPAETATNGGPVPEMPPPPPPMEEPPMEEPPPPAPEPSMPMPDFIESDELLQTGFEYMAVIGVVGTFFQVVIGLLLKFAAAFRWIFTRGL